MAGNSVAGPGASRKDVNSSLAASGETKRRSAMDHLLKSAPLASSAERVRGFAASRNPTPRSQARSNDIAWARLADLVTAMASTSPLNYLSIDLLLGAIAC